MFGSKLHIIEVKFIIQIYGNCTDIMACTCMPYWLCSYKFLREGVPFEKSDNNLLTNMTSDYEVMDLFFRTL